MLLMQDAQGRQWHPTPVLLPGKSHGWRSLVGCSPWGREELEATEWLHVHFSLSCFGEGNGNPLQCSCLENPRDGGAWWAAIYGVTQSQTRLKRLSCSSSRMLYIKGTKFWRIKSDNSVMYAKYWELSFHCLSIIDMLWEVIRARSTEFLRRIQALADKTVI